MKKNTKNCLKRAERRIALVTFEAMAGIGQKENGQKWKKDWLWTSNPHYGAKTKLVFHCKINFPPVCATVGWLLTPDLPSSPDKLLSPNMETKYLIVNISQNTPLQCPMTLQNSSLNWMSAQIYSFTLKFIESWLHLNQGEPAVARFDSIGNHNFPQI